MDSQDHNIKWENTSLSVINSHSLEDGTKYLELFLKDYSILFNKTNLNASCGNCIAAYHKEYSEKMAAQQNESGYVLKKKYVGIALKPGSSVMVNNSNITKEYGDILLKTKGEFLFDKYPKPSKPKVAKKATKKTSKKEDAK